MKHNRMNLFERLHLKCNGKAPVVPAITTTSVPSGATGAGNGSFNLTVNVNTTTNSAAASATSAAVAGLLSVAGGVEVTPRTPEIVNSLIAMTNPFDNYNPGVKEQGEGKVAKETSPPSIQHTCSQLIKEGLKLTLQTKRKASGVVEDFSKRSRKSESSTDFDDEDSSGNNSKSSVGLTPEDEERRRRRRERNKIAATKCRLKKRRKTVILVQESETLETQNHDLKSQIEDLETQRRRLVELLNVHGPNCIKNSQQGSSYQQSQQQQQQQQPPFTTESMAMSNYQENYVPNVTMANSRSNAANYPSIKTEAYHSSVIHHHQQHSNTGSHIHQQYFRHQANNNSYSANVDTGYTV